MKKIFIIPFVIVFSLQGVFNFIKVYKSYGNTIVMIDADISLLKPSERELYELQGKENNYFSYLLKKINRKDSHFTVLTDYRSDSLYNLFSSYYSKIEGELPTIFTDTTSGNSNALIFSQTLRIPIISIPIQFAVWINNYVRDIKKFKLKENEKCILGEILREKSLHLPDMTVDEYKEALTAIEHCFNEKDDESIHKEYALIKASALKFFETHCSDGSQLLKKALYEIFTKYNLIYFKNNFMNWVLDFDFLIAKLSIEEMLKNKNKVIVLYQGFADSTYLQKYLERRYILMSQVFSPIDAGTFPQKLKKQNQLLFKNAVNKEEIVQSYRNCIKNMLIEAANCIRTPASCDFCKTWEHFSQKRFLVCGCCKEVHYCSKGCQQKDWLTHKRNCLKKVRECQKCHKTTEQSKEFLVCGACPAVYYCSKECQKEDWKIHKIDCAYHLKNQK